MKEKSQGFASTEELTPLPLSAVEPRVGGLRSAIRSFSQRENFEHPPPARQPRDGFFHARFDRDGKYQDVSNLAGAP